MLKKIISKERLLNDKDMSLFIRESFETFLERKKILVVPPDITRYHSQAGKITHMLYDLLKEKITDILPALGTHAPMTEKEIKAMYGEVPLSLFRVHKWREDVVTLGEVPVDYIHEISEGKVQFSYPAQVNKLIAGGNHDLIISVGQVVPHEVIGMANYTKNIFVGTGGSEAINKSHFLGAVYGMERIMGRADNPVRKVLNHAAELFLKQFPIIYIHTVIGRDSNGNTGIKGVFIGDNDQCFTEAAALSLEENFTLLDEPLEKVVVYLDPEEFRSTWLGNKAIYRTRMAIADGGELIILAPGVKEFGEDQEIDRLIRKYGYRTTPEVLDAVSKKEELQNNLSAAAHLIHGSSENRFSITYCPGHLRKKEIKQANYQYGDLKLMSKVYDPGYLKDGYNTFRCGTKIYYISNPALGLWASKNRFS